MTDNEIVKGLEVCQNISGETCDDCPYEESKHLDEVMPNGLNYDQMSCDMWLQMDSLDLINRQKAEIEQLQTLVNEMSDFFPACIGCEGKTTLGERTDKCVYEIDNTNYCAKRGITNIAAIQKENRELKAEIERLNKEVETFADIGKMYSEIKAEAVKEFAERLKKEINVRTTFSKEQDKNVLIYIDNILKELVGDDE